MSDAEFIRRAMWAFWIILFFPSFAMLVGGFVILLHDHLNERREKRR